MKPLSRIFIALLAAATTSCASSPATIGIDALGNTNEYVSVCTVKASPSTYIGKVVRIRALYKTDMMYYAYLQSPECKDSPRSIGVDHPIHTHGDESVDAFFLLERSGCRTSTVCPIEFFMDVDLLVKQTDAGLMVEFKHVHFAKART